MRGTTGEGLEARRVENNSRQRETSAGTFLMSLASMDIR